MCGLQVQSNGLKRHMETHEEASRKCPYPECGKAFKQSTTLKAHISSVHLIETSVCNCCGKEVLTAHMANHLLSCNPANVDKITCHICNKTLSSFSMKKLHIEVVHNTPIKDCDLCGKKVKNMGSHMLQVHSDRSRQQRIPCTVCEKTFSTKQAMRKHIEMIHEDKKEQCCECGQWFKNLYDHMKKVHGVGKQHMCNDCGKGFVCNSYLKEHWEKIHGGGKPLKT